MTGVFFSGATVFIGFADIVEMILRLEPCSHVTPSAPLTKHVERHIPFNR